MASTMRDDNRKAEAQLQESTILRMSKAQELEADVCCLCLKAAEKIVKRVLYLHMENLALPLGYVVKFSNDVSGKENAGWKLYKRLEGGEIVINPADPVVEYSLWFYRDIANGLAKKIEEMYAARQKEFTEARQLLAMGLEEGLSKVQTSEESTVTVDSRWSMLEER